MQLFIQRHVWLHQPVCSHLPAPSAGVVPADPRPVLSIVADPLGAFVFGNLQASTARVTYLAARWQTRVWLRRCD